MRRGGIFVTPESEKRTDGLRGDRCRREARRINRGRPSRACTKGGRYDQRYANRPARVHEARGVECRTHAFRNGQGNGTKKGLTDC